MFRAGRPRVETYRPRTRVQVPGTYHHVRGSEVRGRTVRLARRLLRRRGRECADRGRGGQEQRGTGFRARTVPDAGNHVSPRLLVVRSSRRPRRDGNGTAGDGVQIDRAVGETPSRRRVGRSVGNRSSGRRPRVVFESVAKGWRPTIARRRRQRRWW